MPVPYNPSLHRFALLLSCLTLFLVVAGALVTSNDAGLAVPDWPLSFGSLTPPMVGGVFWEHSHRMVASLIGFLTIILAVWLQRAEPRRWLRRLGWIALLAVIAQGVLGGITVLFLLPRPVSISHAGLAQLFFCTICAIAFFTSRTWLSAVPGAPDATSPRARTLAIAAAATIFIQLLLGAAFRHHAIVILPHILWAVVVFAVASHASRTIRARHGSRIPALRRASLALTSMIGAQILLGIATYFALAWNESEYANPVPLTVVITVAHVALGAVTLATSVLLTLSCFRFLSPAPVPAPAAAASLPQTQTDTAARGSQ